MLGDLKNLT